MLQQPMGGLHRDAADVPLCSPPQPCANTYHTLIIFSVTVTFIESKLLESKDCVLVISIVSVLYKVCSVRSAFHKHSMHEHRVRNISNTWARGMIYYRLLAKYWINELSLRMVADD